MNFLTLKKIAAQKKRKQENSCCDWFNFVIEFPFDWIRKLTIPPCEAAHYDKWLVIVWPYFGIMVAQIIAMKAWPTTFEYFLYLPIALVWSITFYCIKGTQDPKDLEEEGSDDDEEDKEDSEDHPLTERHMLPGNWFILISIVGMIWGFIWTYFVSGLMIDALTFIGVLSKLSATYLALTIIAVGNALPDAMLTISLAGKGKAELGITGGYAG